MKLIECIIFLALMTFGVGSILGVSCYIICLDQRYSIKESLVFWWCFVGAISLVSIFLVIMDVVPIQLKL